MERSPGLAVVFRIDDADAREDAVEVRNQLVNAGLDARLRQTADNQGWEVVVPDDQLAAAGEVLAVTQPDAASPGEEVDPSSDLDQVTVFESPPGTTVTEVEALSVKSLLNAAGIPAFIVGAPALPNLMFDVRVPRERVDEARRILTEARIVGRNAVEEEQRTENERISEQEDRR